PHRHRNVLSSVPERPIQLGALVLLIGQVAAALGIYAVGSPLAGRSKPRPNGATRRCDRAAQPENSALYSRPAYYQCETRSYSAICRGSIFTLSRRTPGTNSSRAMPRTNM